MKLKKEFELGFTEKSVPGGTRMVMLYDSPTDLIEVLPLFFSKGIEKKEKCLVIYPNHETKKLMESEIDKLISEKHLEGKMDIEYIDYKDFYFKRNKIDSQKPLKILDKKLSEINYEDIDGVRALGDMSWINNDIFKEIIDVEKGVTKKYLNKEILFLITYPIKNLAVEEIIEIIQSYALVLYKKSDRWNISEAVERECMQTEISDLKDFTDFAIDRELKMADLKEENKTLKGNQKEAND